MINRNFRFTSTLPIRLNAFSDNIDIPDPARRIHPTPIMNFNVAASSVTLPNPLSVANLGIQVGDVIQNVDPSSGGYGGYTTIDGILAAQVFSIADNIGLLTGEAMSIYRPGNDGTMLVLTAPPLGTGDKLHVYTYGGEYDTWELGKAIAFPPVVIKRILSVNPYEATSDPSVLANPIIVKCMFA